MPSTAGYYAPPAAVAAPVDEQSAPQSPWADTSGLKILGWAGGGITVIGVVMLLIVSIQQHSITPTGMVFIGAICGAVLAGAGFALRGRERQADLAVTLVCTGLAVEFTTAFGLVRLAELAGPAAGYIWTAVVVAVGIASSLSWRVPWLAAVSMFVGAILAPIIADKLDSGVVIFETILLIGGVACLLAGVGIMAWMAALLSAELITLLCVGTAQLEPVGLAAVFAATLITWAAVIGRWLTARAPVDPGPFPLRVRTPDPIQTARDYADFAAHERQRALAGSDSTASIVALTVTIGILVLALGFVGGPPLLNPPAGIAAAVCAALLLVLAMAAAKHPRLATTPVVMMSWGGAWLTTAVAIMRLLSGDSRSMGWLLIAILVVLAAGFQRATNYLLLALSAAVMALLAAGPALNPQDLFGWYPPGLLLPDGGLTQRAWTAVLPAGIAVLALCFTSWWAVNRCIGDKPEQERVVIAGWALVTCSAVACYGLLAITMVVAYTIAPDHAGYQGGQIAATVLVTLVAMGLLWLGFRRLILRIGGLGIAAIAVGKVLLLDTSTLQPLPRAFTVVGVGLLLLIAAVGYVLTLRRINQEDSGEPVPQPPPAP